MIKDPRVSIIIPVYNAEKYIFKCLDSCLSQSYQDWEAICIDDASTDSSAEIIKQYTLKDSRIKLISLDNNSGISWALYEGYKNSKGSIIAYLDSDDWWEKTHLEICINTMDLTNADIVNTRYNAFYEETSICKPCYSWNEDFAWHFKLSEYVIVPFFNLGPMKVFKRSLFQGVIFEKGICYLQDSCTSFQLSANSNKSLIIPCYTYNWRIRSNSTTNSYKSPQRIYEDTNTVYNIMLKFLSKNHIEKHYKNIATEWKLKNFLKVLSENLYSSELDDIIADIKNEVDNDINEHFRYFCKKRYSLFQNNSLNDIKQILLKENKNKLRRIRNRYYKYLILSHLTFSQYDKFTEKLNVAKKIYKNAILIKEA